MDILFITFIFFLISTTFSVVIFALIKLLPNELDNKYAIFIPAIILTIIFLFFYLVDLNKDKEIIRIVENAKSLEEVQEKISDIYDK